MSLITARVLSKCTQYIIENCRYRRILPSSNTFYSTTTENRNNSKPDEKNDSPLSENELTFKDETDSITKELSTLTEKNNDLMDKYKRALADGENLRVRMEKQIDEAELYGIQSFCKDLLEVADVLNRATESVPKEEISDRNPHLKSLHEGLVMTEAQLKSVFKRYGLEPVNPVNEKFNPNLHEALFQQDVQDKAPGTVVVVLQIGYKLHERVIRPALVGVAK